jgi:V/A-type H+-transporting ATPase subunit E
MAGGFKIGPKDGGYFISLTEESFRELVGEYMRPATKKILFG